jgi:poly(3-hydroxybutyrate) depolymerase
MREFSSIAVAALMMCGITQQAAAEMVERTGTFGGLKVTYKVVLPSGYDATRTYPGVLVFTGGPQTLQMAGNTLEADWRSEAERRGYVMVSPGTPNGSLFFQDADRIFPDFLNAIIRDYKIRDGKLHIAGHSNGGLSAFHVASRYPKYFTTLIGYPGLLDSREPALMQALKPLCVFMHVGDQDGGWMGAMQREAETMRQQGFKIRITVEKNQVHRLKAQEINLSNRLFEEIESCK